MALPEALRPRGMMFWNLNHDGQAVNGTKAVCDFSAGFNDFLHVRP
jgi:hypothetical protein